MATKQINFRVPEELIEAAQKKAERQKIGVAEYFRRLLERDLKMERLAPVNPGRPRKDSADCS